MNDLFDPLAKAREHIAADARPLTQIAAETGLGASWLRMFRDGHIPDPGFSKVRRVLDYYEDAHADKRRSSGGTQ